MDLRAFQMAAALVLSLLCVPPAAVALRTSAVPLPEYRNCTGYGNNIDHPSWGTAGQPLARLQMPASYPNGTMARQSGPSPRLVSNAVLSVPKRLSSKFDNLMHTYFGQLVALDVVVISRGNEPAAIAVPQGDAWKDPNGIGNTFLPFNRSNYQIINGARQQISEVTAWLDMSWLYSHEPSILALQRRNAAGKGFITLNHFFQPAEATVRNPGLWLLGGQNQINMNPPLHAWFDLFSRYHNLVASQYAEMNPQWDDETVFQEARAWVIAVYQNIASRKFLAATIGRGLSPYTANSYNASTDPTIDNFFATVSFRYGHVLVTPTIPLMTGSLTEAPEGDLFVRDTLYNPTSYYSENPQGVLLDNGVLKGCPHLSILRGTANSLAARSDASMASDLRNFLFGSPDFGYNSSDLAALNIQRARDHGIPSYNYARQSLGLPKMTLWSNISSDPAVQARLASVYPKIDDVDPWVGGIAEDNVASGVVGRLFQSSIYEQFTRLRNGDRLWYERPGLFTETEIEEIHGIGIVDIVNLVYPDEATTKPTFYENPFFVNTAQMNSTTLAASCAYDEIPIDFKNNLRQLAPLMQLSWVTDVEKGQITFLIQACVQGWVGIGFDSDPNSMKNADIIVCRYFPTTKTHECSDRYALDVGMPPLDTAIGGTDDILFSNVSVNAAGVRRFIITRKLDTGDVRDKVIGSNATKLIFAFNLENTNFVYHGPTSSPNNYIRFLNNPIPLSVGLIVFAAVISVLGALVSMFFIGFMVFKPDYYRYQSPTFCTMIAFGSLMGHVSVWTLLAPFNDTSCTINFWLINLAFVFVFACLFLKTWRMWRVVGNRTLKVVTVTVGDVMKIVAVFLAVELAFLVVWTILDRPRALVIQDASFGVPLNTYHLVCKHPLGFFWYISIAVKAAQMLIGVYLTIKVRKLPAIFNDSKQVGVSIYIASFTLLVLIPVSVILEWSLEATYATRVIGASVPFTLINIVLFGGQFLRFMKGKPPVSFAKNVSTTTDGTGSHHRSVEQWKVQNQQKNNHVSVVRLPNSSKGTHTDSDTGEDEQPEPSKYLSSKKPSSSGRTIFNNVAESSSKEITRSSKQPDAAAVETLEEKKRHKKSKKNKKRSESVVANAGSVIDMTGGEVCVDSESNVEQAAVREPEPVHTESTAIVEEEDIKTTKKHKSKKKKQTAASNADGSVDEE